MAYILITRIKVSIWFQHPNWFYFSTSPTGMGYMMSIFKLIVANPINQTTALLIFVALYCRLPGQLVADIHHLVIPVASFTPPSGPNKVEGYNP